MPANFLTALLTSFIGTLGFAVLLHTPRRAWIPGSCIGAVGYTLYWALMVWAGLPETAAIFIGSLAASLMAQYAARRLKMIATIFGTLAIIAFVPGLGLYRCMSLLAQGNTSSGLQTGIAAMSNIVMITFGLGMGSFLMRMFFAGRAEKKRGCA